MGKSEIRILAGAAIGLLFGLSLRAFLMRPPVWEKLPPTASAVTEVGAGGAP